MMNNIFWDLIAKDIMIVYLDIILIFTQILKEYYKVIHRVMEVLAKYKLLSNSINEKTTFSSQM